MKIEKILQNKLGYTLFIEDCEYFLVEDLMVKGNFYKNTEINEKTFQDIITWNLVSLAFLKIKSFINFRPRSINEVKMKLKLLNFEEEVIDNTCLYLQEFKIVDDELYTKYYVNYFILNVKKGRFILRNKLKEKGIDEHIIELALKEYKYENEKNNALKVIKKAHAACKDKNFHYINNKLRMTLKQNGFDQDFLKHFQFEINKSANSGVELERLYEKLVKSDKIYLFKSQAYSKGYKNEQIDLFLEKRKINETNI